MYVLLVYHVNHVCSCTHKVVEILVFNRFLFLAKGATSTPTVIRNMPNSSVHIVWCALIRKKAAANSRR